MGIARSGLASAFAASLLAPTALPTCATAQVINGESTADSGYAPPPPARWSAPSGRPQPSAIDPQDDGDQPAADTRRDRD